MPVWGTLFLELGPLKISKEHLHSGSFMLSKNQYEIANSSAAINPLSVWCVSGSVCFKLHITMSSMQMKIYLNSKTESSQTDSVRKLRESTDS